MAKMKTHSAAKKRFKKTGGKTLKIKRAAAFRRHLLTKKNAKTKQQLRQPKYISKADLATIAQLLPY